MDAAAADADVKLYKASTEILEELQQKLPALLCLSSGKPRKWVFRNKTSELMHLLDYFQEWPQLLDSSLASMVSGLVSAFLGYCINSQDCYCQENPLSSTTEQSPRAICRLLYTFCKVRGYKIIVRLLNNEPKYIELLITSFQRWTRNDGNEGSKASWEERYIMLLWLSHLMLAPFRLATISVFSAQNFDTPDVFRTLGLPTVAQVLLDIAFRHLYAPGKDRESSSLLIVRLALREDMQNLNLPRAAVTWCLTELNVSTEAKLTDQYRHVGLLTLLYRLTKSSTSTEAAPFVAQVFETCQMLALEDTPAALAARRTAPCRKLLVKILRASMLHALSLSANPNISTALDVDTMLEQGVEILLELLADTDTPVRQASSKALGVVIMELESDLGAEVVEAVLACLNENILLENIQTGQLTVATELMGAEEGQYKKNVNAVNSLKWHGAMLTLGHVLFRRCPPPTQLPSVLDALIMGLQFEQRSNVGTSLGIGVRDAACFGIWSLARKYTSEEINAAEIHTTPSEASQAGDQATLQIVATELVLASCLDPSGNLRRGASAALQELIGRHPDIVCAGIPLVQCVDYHAVARRSRAISDVAYAVADLDENYHMSLIYACLDWRGCRAVDAESRRQAACAIRELLNRASPDVRTAFTEKLLSKIGDLKDSNSGANAAARHGLVLALVAVLQVVHSCIGGSDNENAVSVWKVVCQALSDFECITGNISGRITADLTLVLEAVANLIAVSAKIEQCQDVTPIWVKDGSPVMLALDRCTTASEDSLLATVVSYANLEVFQLLPLVSKIRLCSVWLPDHIPNGRTVFTCKGRLMSISMIFQQLGRNSSTAAHQVKFAKYLASIVDSSLPIEARVNAMNGVSIMLDSDEISDPTCVQNFVVATQCGLTDYTTDQRGDVGSLLRISSIEAVMKLSSRNQSSDVTEKMIPSVARLATEKLIKVRYAAWFCLEHFFSAGKFGNRNLVTFNHQADMSSFTYFRQLASLLEIAWIRTELLQGFVSSIAGGADDVSQTASEALLAFLDGAERKDRQAQIVSIVDDLIVLARACEEQDDREVVPLLDTLCLVIEQFPEEVLGSILSTTSELLSLLDRLQTTIADIPRIQSIIRILSLLSGTVDTRVPAIDRISRKLLHKWPRVRQGAADAIYLLDEEAMPSDVDWNAPPMINKSQVVELRKSLRVTSSSDKNTKA